MRPVVFAQVSVATAEVVLLAGDPWDARDPVVRAHPDLFGPVPPDESVRCTLPPAELEDVPSVRGRRRLL